MVEKILIVEDELTLQETLAYNLKHQGYEVEIADDGQTAIDKVHHVFWMNSGIAYVLVSSLNTRI